MAMWLRSSLTRLLYAALGFNTKIFFAFIGQCHEAQKKTPFGRWFGNFGYFFYHDNYMTVSWVLWFIILFGKILSMLHPTKAVAILSSLSRIRIFPQARPHRTTVRGCGKSYNYGDCNLYDLEMRIEAQTVSDSKILRPREFMRLWWIKPLKLIEKAHVTHVCS